MDKLNKWWMWGWCGGGWMDEWINEWRGRWKNGSTDGLIDMCLGMQQQHFVHAACLPTHWYLEADLHRQGEGPLVVPYVARQAGDHPLCSAARHHQLQLSACVYLCGTPKKNTLAWTQKHQQPKHCTDEPTLHPMEDGMACQSIFNK